MEIMQDPVVAAGKHAFFGCKLLGRSFEVYCEGERERERERERDSTMKEERRKG